LDKEISCEMGLFLIWVSYLASTSTPQPMRCRKDKVVASGGGWVWLSWKGAKAAPSLMVFPRMRGCCFNG
jgi:hypothetical protein